VREKLFVTRWGKRGGEQAQSLPQDLQLVTGKRKYKQVKRENKKSLANERTRPSFTRCRMTSKECAAYLLLLRLDERFSPCWLLRWLLPREALPRSDCELLLRLLLPRLLPLDALLRLLRPEDDDFELPDFMVTAPLDLNAARVPTRSHTATLGALHEVCVGWACACM
jgi:hypothetical protein